MTMLLGDGPGSGAHRLPLPQPGSLYHGWALPPKETAGQGDGVPS